MPTAAAATSSETKMSDGLGAAAHVPTAAAALALTSAFPSLLPSLGPLGIAHEPFPVKLYEMLEAAPRGIVAWTDGGDAFLVRNGKLLCTDVLPHYFRHHRLASFQRQLNLCARAHPPRAAGPAPA